MPDLIPSRLGHRCTTHQLELERLGGGRWAIRFRDTGGYPHFITGPWSDSVAAASARARQLIRRERVSRRNT
jgi:hypothetical protein